VSGQRRDLLDLLDRLDDPLEDDLLDDRDDEYVRAPWPPMRSPGDSDRSAPSDRLKDPAPPLWAMAPESRVPMPSPPAGPPWKAP
jgi:hypothetical protein